jgi:AraC-like DNA-binding protein
MGILEVAFNMEVLLGIGVVVSFAFAFLLLLIKVPRTEYSIKLATTKNTIAVCLMICGSIFTYTFQQNNDVQDLDYDRFASYMMLIVNAFSSCILSYSLIILLDSNKLDKDRFILNIAIAAGMSILLERSFWWSGMTASKTAVVVSYVFLFLVQCAIYILKFRQTYHQSVKSFEKFYDEDKDNKLKWIRFAFVMMMLTQLFVLVYMLLPHGFMKVYAGWYSLFILYFTSNFISFLGSHKIVLEAFAYKTLSGQDLHLPAFTKKKPEKAKQITDKQLAALEYRLNAWVEEKKFREYDKSKEQIAKELKTTKEIITLYFATIKECDFRTWRTELRIADAKEILLEQPELSTNAVAEMCGFSDRSNFHRQFTKITGLSPKQWRESQISNGKA